MASGSSPTPAFRPAGKRSKISTVMKVVWGVLSVAGVALASFVIVNIFGRVHGLEICAETLERRSFMFLEIPLIRIQVRATQHIDLTGDLEKHLAAQNFVQQPPAAKKTWHVIHVGGFMGIRHGDPQILVRYLDARNSNQELAWLEWTKAHPTLAPFIWKGVCDLALAGEYTTIPDVLEMAQGASDPVQTQAAVSKLVTQATKPAPAPAPAKTPAK